MPNVLVVDNSDAFLKLMRSFLLQQGHTVQTAESGIAALQLLEHIQPQIIFIDMVMPDMGGETLCRVIRSREHLKGVFIAIISPIAAEQHVDCTDFGANICIAKGPFDVLQEHVATVIELFHEHGSSYRTSTVLGIEAVYEREITKELLFSKNHFEIIIAHLNEGFIELNREGRIIFANPAATELLGLSVEELLTAVFHDLFREATGEKIRKLLASIGDQPQQLGEDPPIIHNRKNLVLSFLPVLEPLQQSVIVMIHDVSQRMHLEGELQKHQEFLEELIAERTARLRQSRKQLARAQQIANLGNWDYDLGSGEMIWSPEMCRIFGRPDGTQQASMQAYLETVESADRPFVEEAFRSLTPFKMDRELIRPDGSNCMVHEQTEVIPGPDGRPERIVGIVQDITERKSVEEALRESEEKYRQLFNENTDAVIIFDVETLLIEESNQAAVGLLGSDREKMLTMRATELFLDPAALPDISRQKDQNPRDSLHLPETEIKRHDGSVFPAELRLGFFESNHRQKIIASIRDITLRKKLEQELRQAQKMEAIGTLAGGIAHDFNNILTAIMGHSEVALASLQGDKKPFVNLEEIVKASGRAKELVKQILTFSRMTDKSLKPLEIHFIVKEVLKLIRASTPRSIEIREKISPNCGSILADPTQIHQLVINLCSNAIDAMPGKGLMEVRLQKTRLPEPTRDEFGPDLPRGKYVKLSVTDSGCGIDEKIRHRIFEPFFTTKDVGKGTGMGLSMVHGIVQNHKGAIVVESSPGGGSAFHVFFPLTEEKIEKSTVLTDPLPMGNERILLVDDERSILDANRSFLAKLGYTVVTKDQPLDALRLFEEQPDSFDLVITDQAMPELTGDELASRLLRIRPEMPVLLVTGFSSSLTEEKLQEIGIRELILKPISPTNLAKRIRKVMDN